MLHFFKLLLFLCVIFMSYNFYERTHSMSDETCLTSGAFDNRYASYNATGNKIIFESNRDGNWEVYMMNSDGSNAVRITDNAASDRRPSWHPKEHKILFESDRSGKNELYTYNLNSNSISKVPVKVLGKIIFSRFSPDGKTIVFSAEEAPNNFNIYTVSSDGKYLHTVIDNAFRNTFPSFSKNGKQLLYFSRKETGNKDDEIYIYDLNSKRAKRLTNWPKHNFCPSWSNDNKRIAYVTSMEKSRPEIYIMEADGSNQQRITYNKDGDTLPNWSPDDSRLLITAYRNGNYQICEIKLN